MTRKQIALILVANALISTVIASVALVIGVLLVRDRLEGTPRPTATRVAIGATATQPVAGVATTLPGGTTPIIHVVKAGDTLTGLALQYDVPVEEIMAANNLTNPNLLRVGAELIIPVGGVPNVTATFTPAPTGTDTPIPYEPPSADMTATAAARAGATVTPFPTPVPPGGELRVNITQVLAPGQLSQEGVTLTNVGSGVADMQGWTLSSSSGSTYTFPKFRLWAGGVVTVYTRVGEDNSPPSSLYWGKLQAVWASGGKVTLKDAADKVIASYAVP